jgi:predicted PurR-regulated permease PerM
MKRFFGYFILFIVLSIFFGWYFSNITLYLVLSLILAAILRPFTNRLHTIHILGQHPPRWLPILISFASIVGIFILLSLLFFPLINQQILVITSLDLNDIYIQIQPPISKIESFLIRYNLIEANPGFLFEQTREAFFKIIKNFDVASFISSLFDTTLSLLVGILAVTFITFFLLLENGILRRNLLNLIPNAYFELSVATFTKVEKLLSNYLIGLFFQILAIFFLASLGLTLVDVEYALSIALFAAIANLIPYAGPVFGSIFGLVIGISTGDFSSNTDFTYHFIKIASVFASVQLIDNLVLQPMIFSKSVKAHPLEIFVVIFAGAKIAGVIGMISAIPVYTIFRVSIMEFYQGYKSYRIFK